MLLSRHPLVHGIYDSEHIFGNHFESFKLWWHAVNMTVALSYFPSGHMWYCSKMKESNSSTCPNRNGWVPGQLKHYFYLPGYSIYC